MVLRFDFNPDYSTLRRLFLRKEVQASLYRDSLVNMGSNRRDMHPEQYRVEPRHVDQLESEPSNYRYNELHGNRLFVHA